MPPLYEADLLYMPITVPGSNRGGQAPAALAGRADPLRARGRAGVRQGGPRRDALDPAPLSMFETIVRLKPRKTSGAKGMTIERITAELSEKVASPGVQGAWTMPIKARIDMLSTGIRTPIGVKVFGKDLATISRSTTSSSGSCAKCLAPAASTPSASSAGSSSTSRPTAKPSPATG
jgi:Cu(I)/Ag(I) efflux system membrane protein CusA/SilA